MELKATLQATPTNYEGPVPALITFEGTIEVNGLAADCTLQYRFLRSDGAYDRNKRLIEVKKPGGVFPVSTTWTLAPPQYTGWEAIEVVAPERVVSNRASFSVKCWRPDLTVNTFQVHVNTQDRSVKFAAVLMNVGNVDVSGPFKVIIGAGIGLWTVQDTVDVPASVVIPPNGRYVTDYGATQELFENNEYWVDIILDPDRKLKDLNRANDRLQARWISPDM
ncbi:hypothetical protein ACO9S2_15920 [Nitrospira sp. NS4]|uniref:hypothetical protein n=1 Tax=Nitrospira sp. NS4 TaxID=3414498 RepID=UPI003C2F19DB